MTSSLYGLYRLGYTRCRKDKDRKGQRRELEFIFKFCLSSDYSLQLENMKKESLVIADQQAAVNCFLI